MEDWKSIEKEYYMPVFDRLPLVIVRGKGSKVWDEQGKEYIDFVGGWATCSLGHCPEVVVEAATEQLKTLIQVSNSYYTIPQLKLAELLVKNSCLNKAFLANSGAEANEGAVKLARRYGKLRLGGAYRIITALGSFHGRTLAMTAATGQAKFQSPYTPLPFGFLHVPYDDIDALKEVVDRTVCAVMLEPIQGEHGVIVPHPDYLMKVRRLCDENGILLILDEVQTGMGRTGTLFAYEQFGIEPDILTLAKGLAGGLPIGAVMAKESCSCFKIGEHGSTFGGNPVSSAAGYAALKFIIDNNVPQGVAEKGRYFKVRLEALKSRFSFISDVRGLGLLLALEFDSDIARRVTMNCLEAGLLVNSVKANTLRFMPPLTISREELDQGLSILESVLSSKEETF